MCLFSVAISKTWFSKFHTWFLFPSCKIKEKQQHISAWLRFDSWFLVDRGKIWLTFMQISLTWLKAKDSFLVRRHAIKHMNSVCYKTQVFLIIFKCMYKINKANKNTVYTLDAVNFKFWFFGYILFPYFSPIIKI